MPQRVRLKLFVEIARTRVVTGKRFSDWIPVFYHQSSFQCVSEIGMEGRGQGCTDSLETCDHDTLGRVFLGHILVILKSEYANKTVLFTFPHTKTFSGTHSQCSDYFHILLYQRGCAIFRRYWFWSTVPETNELLVRT